MEAQAVKLTVLGQICLYTGVLLSILLKPSGLSSNDGLSYFGIFARTVIPYSLGLLSSAYLSWLASKHVSTPELKPLHDGYITIAILTVAIVITPYSVGPLLGWAHTAAGTALFSLQLLLSAWLTYQLHYHLLAVILTAIEFIAGVACAVYLLPEHGLLMQCQVLFQLAFGMLLIFSLARLKSRTKAVLP